MFFYNDNGENMKNRGFTLVELLGVITLMALLSLAAFEVLDSVNKGNKEKAEETQIANVIDAAISFVPTSHVKLPNISDAYLYNNCEGKSSDYIVQAKYGSKEELKKLEEKLAKYKDICETKVTLEYLSNEGLIDEKVKNPITGKYYSKDSGVRIFLVTDKTAAEKRFKQEPNAYTKMETPWKYDGNYIYVFDYKDEEVFYDEK